jgi:hypothetical protein
MDTYVSAGQVCSVCCDLVRYVIATTSAGQGWWRHWSNQSRDKRCLSPLSIPPLQAVCLPIPQHLVVTGVMEHAVCHAGHCSLPHYVPESRVVKLAYTSKGTLNTYGIIINTIIIVIIKSQSLPPKAALYAVTHYQMHMNETFQRNSAYKNVLGNIEVSKW